MTYYPQTSVVMGMTTVRRERRLPPHAIGEVLVNLNSLVDPATVVLRGAVPSDFVILDSLKALGLKWPQDIDPENMLQVEPGEVVEPGQPILSVGSGRRVKSFVSPLRAVFARLEGSRVILQTNPVPVEIQALSPGIVTSIREDRAVLIETLGALVQGAWGNGKGVYAALSVEPEGGVEALQGDDFLKQYQGTAMIVNHPIVNPAIFMIANQQEIAALIAPSMRSNLREAALKLPYPVLLTEGFGEMQMSEIVYNLLRSNANRTATIDAVEPGRWSTQRPEIVIPLPSGGAKPRTPEKDQPLVEGAVVRFTRAPLAGKTGRVRRVLDDPRPVENGLRLVGAEVLMPDEKIVFAPLANLELLGRPVEAQGRS